MNTPQLNQINNNSINNSINNNINSNSFQIKRCGKSKLNNANNHSFSDKNVKTKIYNSVDELFKALPIYKIKLSHIKSFKIEEIIQYLRLNNVPTDDKRMTIRFIKALGVVYDDFPTTYTYYVSFINSVLNSLRNGNKDYVFNLCQLQDLLKYEPKLEIEFKSNYFEVSLPTE